MRSIIGVLTITVLLGTVMIAAGCTQPSADAGASADYQQKLGRSQAALANLTAAYQEKAGVMMSQQEFKAWLELDRNLTMDLLATSNETLAAGQTYLRQLQPDSTEYITVTSNEATIKANIDVAREKYNAAVDSYNKFWSGQDSEFVHI